MSAKTPAQLWELLISITAGTRTIDELAAEYETFAARTRAQQAAAPPLALRQLADAVAAATHTHQPAKDES